MWNKYEIKGEETHIHTKRRDGKELTVIIDTEDLPKIESATKSIFTEYKRNINGFYAVTGNGIFLHRFLTNAPKGMVVDHINHNSLDNRKSNLRICTYSENAQNLNGCTSRSKSGIRGVCWDKCKNYWIARVVVSHKEVFRKTYKNKEDATKAVLEARQKYMPHIQEAI